MTLDARPDVPLRLAGSTRPVIRAAWVAVTVLCLGALLASFPPAYEKLRAPVAAVAAGLKQVGLAPEWFAFLSLAPVFTTAAAFVLVSWLIAWRTPGDGATWFMAFCLTVFGTAGLASAVGPPGSAITSLFEALVIRQPGWSWLTTLLSTVAWILGGFFFLLFPDGHFVPPWSWIIGLEWIAWIAAWYLFPAAPFSPPNWPPVLFVIGANGHFVVLLAAQVYRYYRVSRPSQRQQTKWLVLGIGLALALDSVVNVLAAYPAWVPVPSLLRALFLSLLRAAAYLSVSAIPLSIGVAMLRYRLWDIDLIIRRTLVYSALTALLAGVYVGSVVVLQGAVGALTGQRQSPAVIVLSTLASAALFFPLRQRVQAFIDRRFYRRKYDAARTLAAFALTARDETDFEALKARLLAVVDETMQPEQVGLWLKAKAPPAERDGP